MTWADLTAAMDGAVFAALDDETITIGPDSFGVMIDKNVTLMGDVGEVIERVTQLTAQKSDVVLTVGSTYTGTLARYTVRRIIADDGLIMSASVTESSLVEGWSFDSTDVTFDSTEFTFDQT